MYFVPFLQIPSLKDFLFFFSGKCNRPAYGKADLMGRCAPGYLLYESCLLTAFENKSPRSRHRSHTEQEKRCNQNNFSFSHLPLLPLGYVFPFAEYKICFVLIRRNQSPVQFIFLIHTVSSLLPNARPVPFLP